MYIDSTQHKMAMEGVKNIPAINNILPKCSRLHDLKLCYSAYPIVHIL